MELCLDLHIHSGASPDGRMTAAEIVAAAREAGLDGAAICDHGRLFVPDRDLALPEDFLLIPGEEFSTEFGHLLGLFLSRELAYERLPKEADRREKTAHFRDLCDGIHAQGGLCVLAHPFERDPDPDRLSPILDCLDGLEVWNGRANRKRPTANDEAAAFAAARALPAFAGSDAHLRREIGNGRVRIEVPDRDRETVKAALLQPGNPVSGRNGRHLDAARSQRTRLKKTRAGLAARLKWLAFAAKCAAEDVRVRE